VLAVVHEVSFSRSVLVANSSDKMVLSNAGQSTAGLRVIGMSLPRRQSADIPEQWSGMQCVKAGRVPTLRNSGLEYRPEFQ